MLFYFSYIECQNFVILLSFFSHSAFTFLSEEWRKNALLRVFCIDRLESQQFSFFLSQEIYHIRHHLLPSLVFDCLTAIVNGYQDVEF